MSVQIDGALYSLEVKDPREISLLWQTFQIIFYICSIVLSFSVIVCFSDVVVVMQHNCILDADLFLVRGSQSSIMNTNNVSCVIDTVRSNFHEGPCNVVMFVPVVVITFTCFFVLMFVICGRGGAGRRIPDAWRIVVPAIIFNLISFCLILYAAIVFQSGVRIFLYSIKHAWGVREIELSEINCLNIDGKQLGERLANGLYRVKEFIWLLVVSSGFSFLWIILRFLFAIDFKLVQISSHLYPSTTKALIHKPLIHDIIPKVIQDNEDSDSNVSDGSFYTAQSELSLESKQSIPPKAQAQSCADHFDDNLQEFKNKRKSSQLRDVSLSTDISFPASLKILEEN